MARSPARSPAVSGALAAGVGLRTVYLVLHPAADYVTSDMAEYVARARHLAGSGPLPRTDFFFPVGTQALLSVPLRLFGTGRPGLWAASILWWGLSCSFPWLAWRWATTVMGPRPAAICAVGCALSPLAILYGGYFSSELPALVLLPAALWLLTLAVRSPGWRTGVAAGAVSLLLLTVRQQLLLNLVIAAVALRALWRHRVPRVAAAIGAGAVLAGAVVVVVGAPPWRYQDRLPPVLGQNGGVNFFYGHCDVHTLTAADLTFQNPVRVLSHTGHDVSVKPHRGSEQGFFYRGGIDCIARDPIRAVELAGRSVLDMTTTTKPFPPVVEGGAVLTIAVAANGGFCALLLLLAAAAIRRARRDAVAALLLVHLAAAFVAAVVFLGEPRYRIPYDLFGWALLGWWVDARSGAREDHLEGRPG